MNPKEYEVLICEHFRREGYKAETTSYTNDFGVDVFAAKGNEKIAIQAKMYGNNRKINRQMVMELHGAKDYFDCSKAIIVTDGDFLADAISVAEKLNIEILKLPSLSLPVKIIKASNNTTFEQIWEDYIIPLQGKILTRSNGNINEIVRVDWSQIERKTSNGNINLIKIEIFKLTINKLLQDGSITRDFVNQNYVGRASSGVILILAQVPFFQVSSRPAGLTYLK